MSSFSEFLKKAHSVLNGMRGTNAFFLGRDGDVVYSKNNVCIHESLAKDRSDEVHCPGYLTIHCQGDENIGVTLILQWLPNITLQKNPASIRSVSPRCQSARAPNEISEAETTTKSERVAAQELNDEDSNSSVSLEIHVEEIGKGVPVREISRPTTLLPPQKLTSNAIEELDVPLINVIPHTPMGPDMHHKRHSKRDSESSQSTSCADEFSGTEKDINSSECNSSEEDENPPDPKPAVNTFSKDSFMLYKTPEQFALEHDLMLTEVENEEKRTPRKSAASLFSVNLGKMRSLRLFYSNTECTSGQLVIATLDSHYKILHFHHGGLDKLATLFEQWSAIKAKSFKDGSPTGVPDRHFIICHPEVSRLEMDPEEGLFDRLALHSWRSYESSDGVIEDSATIRKNVFFASMESCMRRKVWPFLLGVYPWMSSAEQREAIKNELFLEYQQIRKRRHKAAETMKAQWAATENSIIKDVVRTDRRNPFFYGDNNPNVDVMKNILLNYAAAYPDVNYIQGMSDLLSPILSTLRDEVEAYWCFHGFMQQTVFSSTPQGNENLMEINLVYLRNLLRLLVPDFYDHLDRQKPDAMQLMFVHRWILLCFKREFPEDHAFHIWECCWARYRTNYFHLFVCVAIVATYGQDVISQNLPHDEILLYFSSLAHHMDAHVVLQKARGLLCEVVRRESIPCALSGLFTAEHEQWNSHRKRLKYYCNQAHDDQFCPFVNIH